MMAVAQITWTRFIDRAASSARQVHHDWPELVEHLRHAGPFAAKSVCPWIKLATFGAHRTVKGALRSDGNLIEITGVEGDYDGELVQPEAAVELLERAGVKALVYTSPSHTPGAPRWRVLAPLSAPHAPADRTRLLARINGALGGLLTAESFTLSQSYYYGRVEGQADYRVLVTWDDPEDGAFVDELHQLDQIAQGAPGRAASEGAGGVGGHAIATAVEAAGRRLRTGDGRRELLKSYIGDKSNRGLTADEIRVLVDDVVSRFFDPSDPVDWSNVNSIITTIEGNDARERAQVAATVGGFVERVTAAAAPASPSPMKLRRSMVNFGALRPVTWVIPGFVSAGQLVVWAGQPGVGKSTVIASLSMVVAGWGQEIGSDIPNDRPRRVVIVSEHPEQYERLFFGFINAFGLDKAAIDDSILLYDATRLRASEIKAEIEAVAAAAAGDEPPLVVLDTASASFEVSDENSNAEVGGVMAALKKPVDALKLPLWVIAHAAKALGREDSEITPRGASAFIGDAHGTGSVFRDKSFPDSTFIRSLKSRNEREFTEIEIRTTVQWHEVADDRGVIQRLGIRLGVPMISGEGQRASAAADTEASVANVLKSNRAKGNAIQGAIVAALAGAPNKTLKCSDLVSQLVEQGFKRSPAYRAIDQLVAQVVLTEAGGRVHLNGQGAPKKEG